jgi:peptidoglycan/LPS O-acetylase OafA/YrhL
MTLDTRTSPLSPARASPPLQHDAAPDREQRVPVLDGWRAVSILCVLVAHWLPLGRRGASLNHSLGLLGMSLFFTLSGYLITGTLLRRPAVGPFLIRRLCRILPLAILYAVLVLLFVRASPGFYPPYLLFYSNYDHAHLISGLTHFWSLCVEVHFYMAVAVIVLVLGRRGLYVLPVLCVLVTINRAMTGTMASIVTHLRVDEILAGATLALIGATPGAAALRAAFGRLPVVPLLLLAAATSHKGFGPLTYFRPYCAAGLVGATLYGALDGPGRIRGALRAFLCSAPARYVADTSYALYVIHPITSYGWMSDGGPIVKYLLKRPVSVALTVLGAHLSTFYYERYFISLGKRWTRSSKPAAAVTAEPTACPREAGPPRDVAATAPAAADG